MKLLLDTHILLWCLGTPDRLSSKTRSIIEDGETVIWVSSASAWEIKIKTALGKLTAPNDLEEQVEALGFHKLSITFEHAQTLRKLGSHHTDPFDRMLVAQAICHSLTIVTKDPKLKRYDVDILAP